MKENNPDIEKLSLKQKKINKDINSTNDQEIHNKLKKQRNKIITEIHETIKTEENNKLG